MYCSCSTPVHQCIAGWHHGVFVTICSVCGGNLKDRDHGIITSPGYPGVYPHNRDCAWTVTVSPGNIILFTFGHLAMEAHTNCSYDYLKVCGLHSVCATLNQLLRLKLTRYISLNDQRLYKHFHQYSHPSSCARPSLYH